MTTPSATPSLESVGSTFDAWAADGRAEGMEDDHRDVVLQMLDRAELAPQHHVLDVGCGTGWTVRLLARVVAQGRAHGVDLSGQMIARARSAATPANASFTAAPVHALPFATDSLDRVVSMESIYYWSELEAGLREIRRVLRPGGRFLVAMEYFRENPHSAHWGRRMGLALHHLSAPEWEARLQDAGFTQVGSELLHDRRRRQTAAEFGADPCHPDYQNYLAHKEAGALLLRAGKAPAQD
ncbi:MAG: class I SAM-dependent methyltransferase [Planctomycetota bacterium]|nr:MAG: class I SAM-dependent methyltransferase [Planctomycetota bacterium]